MARTQHKETVTKPMPIKPLLDEITEVIREELKADKTPVECPTTEKAIAEADFHLRGKLKRMIEEMQWSQHTGGTLAGLVADLAALERVKPQTKPA